MEDYTRFEKARIIGSRALQIDMGAPFIAKISAKELEEMRFNPVEIAKKEFEEGLIPITVKRTLPHDRNKEPEKEE